MGTIMHIDAMSVFQSIAAVVIREPAEKGLAAHLYWMREKLERNQLSVLRWTDTRDMNADCHTKGSILRGAVLAYMQGSYAYSHAFKDFVQEFHDDANEKGKRITFYV